METSKNPQTPIDMMNNAKYSMFHKFLVLAGFVGVFTDVYIIVNLPASTFSVIPHLLKTHATFALTAALLYVGQVAGVLTTGIIYDRLGRKNTLVVALAIIVILSIVSAFVTTVTELDIVRLLIGYFTGAEYPGFMALVSEFMPTKYRARGISYLWVGFTVGGVVGFVVGYFLYGAIGPTPTEWRIMLGSAAIPAFIAMVLTMFTSESPRWSLEKEKFSLAKLSIKRATGTEFSQGDLEAARKTLFDVRVERNIRSNYRKYAFILLPIVFGLLFFNLTPGSLATLNPIILSSLGISQASTYLYSASFLAVQAVAVLIVSRTVEKVGRMKWAVIGGVIEAASSFAVLAIYHNPIALFGIFMSMSFFAWIAIPVMRSSGSELFPTEFRGFSSGAVIAGDRSANILGILSTPFLFAGHNVNLLFSVYAVGALVGVILTIAAFRGRKLENRSLEEIQDDLLKEAPRA